MNIIRKRLQAGDNTDRMTRSHDSEVKPIAAFRNNVLMSRLVENNLDPLALKGRSKSSRTFLDSTGKADIGFISPFSKVSRKWNEKSI